VYWNVDRGTEEVTFGLLSPEGHDGSFTEDATNPYSSSKLQSPYQICKTPGQGTL
jgi:hypothetical protein